MQKMPPPRKGLSGRDESRPFPIASLTVRKHGTGTRSWRRTYALALSGLFILLAGIMLMNELIDIKHLVLGTDRSPVNWPEALIETAFVLLVAAAAFFVASKVTGEISKDINTRKYQKIFSDILIHTSPTYFLAMKPDWSIITLSSALLKKTGYTLEEVVGKDFLTLFVPREEHASVLQIAGRLGKEDSPAENETRLMTRDGERFIVQWDGRAAYRENGELDFLYGAGIDITDRKEAEDALRHSEERYRSFAQNLKGIAYQQTIDFNPVFLHGDVEEITGYREEDFLNGSPHWKDIVLEEDREPLREKLSPLRTIPGFAAELTYRIVRKNGELRWIREYIQNICVEEGSPSGVQGVVYDITSTMKAEESHRLSEKRYRLLAENVQDVIWAIDRDFRYTYISPSVQKMRGYTVEEAMSLPLEKVFTENPQTKVMGLIAEQRILLESGQEPDYSKPVTLEAELVCKDGSSIWADVTISYVLDANGRHAGYVGMTRDITEKKKAQEAIRLREETYRAIFESTGTAMVIIEKDTIISLANGEFEKLSGYTRKEIEGRKPWTDFVFSDDIDRMMKYHLHRREPSNETPRNYDFRFIDRNGLIKDVFVTATLISGTMKAIVSLLDITDAKMDAEELRVSREQLRNLHKHSQDVRERERARVAREIHDELGQVLTALKMDLSFLEKKLPPDLPSLRTKTNHMQKFVDMTIQSVKRITMDLRPGLLDHLGLVAAIEWQAEEFQKRTGIRYSITLDPEDIDLNPDKSTSVFRIFQETLTNITRHAHATEVRISLLEKHDALELTVSDNGIGISREQIENPKSFGLMGIKERAYFSGGQAKIFGKKGTGTTVLVSIPLNKVRDIDDTSAGC